LAANNKWVNHCRSKAVSDTAANGKPKIWLAIRLMEADQFVTCGRLFTPSEKSDSFRK